MINIIMWQLLRILLKCTRREIWLYAALKSMNEDICKIFLVVHQVLFSDFTFYQSFKIWNQLKSLSIIQASFLKMIWKTRSIRQRGGTKPLSEINNSDLRCWCNFILLIFTCSVSIKHSFWFWVFYEQILSFWIFLH